MNFIKKTSEQRYDLSALLSKDLTCKYGKPENWKPNFAARNLHIKDELNSNFFRSEEFKTSHDGMHILFAGCSYTWGEGVGFKDTWAHQTYKKISNDQAVSGYFNIGTPGTSIANQVVDIFKYTNLYGNPDVIFLNMPNIDRFYYTENCDIYDGYYEQSDTDISLIAYQYYLMLDIYCKSNDIKLVAFSWDWSGYTNIALKDFKTFNVLRVEEVMDQVFILQVGARLMSDDKMHVGEAYHQAWANIIYDRFTNDKG